MRNTRSLFVLNGAGAIINAIVVWPLNHMIALSILFLATAITLSFFWEGRDEGIFR